jgi:hypothetical protein
MRPETMGLLSICPQPAFAFTHEATLIQFKVLEGNFISRNLALSKVIQPTQFSYVPLTPRL